MSILILFADYFGAADPDAVEPVAAGANLKPEAPLDAENDPEAIVFDYTVLGVPDPSRILSSRADSNVSIIQGGGSVLPQWTG